MWRTVELVILGGGCAGLSLASRLCKLGYDCPKTLVIEQRRSYGNDRTWCFWHNHKLPLGDWVTHEWQRLRLAHGDQTLDFDCGTNAYQIVTAAKFYAHATQAIAANPAIELVMDTAVTAEPCPSAAGWTIETALGTVHAKLVLDARTTTFQDDSAAVLWQSFYGQEVVCDEDWFNPAQAVLMDFTATAGDQISFAYVLPTSPRHALIEATVFGPRPLRAADLADQLERAKADHAGGLSLAVRHSEQGVLPMGLNRPAPSLGHGHARAGIMAGAARPSSGFAFQRIQQWANRCSQSIASGQGPVGHAPDPLAMRMMDRLFLKVIRNAPQMAPALFMSIFDKADNQSVIRFLSGTASLRDCLQVMAALPTARFVSQLLRPAAVGGFSGAAK